MSVRLRPALSAAALVVSLAVSALAAAGDIRPFTAGGFAALQSAGRPVLVDVHADWCPTCAQQQPIVERLLQEPAFADVTVLTVDFDAQKPELRRLRAASQSTLIAFHGTTETGRTVGDTTLDGIRALLQRTLN